MGTLLSGLNFSALLYLDVSKNSIGDAGAVALANAILVRPPSTQFHAFICIEFSQFFNVSGSHYGYFPITFR